VLSTIENSGQPHSDRWIMQYNTEYFEAQLLKIIKETDFTISKIDSMLKKDMATQKMVLMMDLKCYAANYPEFDDEVLKESERVLPILKQKIALTLKHRKFENDFKACAIFALNVNIKGFEKRRVQFKRHMHEYLEAFEDLDNHSLTDIRNGDNILKNEEGYRFQCEIIQGLYTSLTDDKVVKIINSPEWKAFRYK
jgi:hypothetical protein